MFPGVLLCLVVALTLAACAGIETFTDVTGAAEEERGPADFVGRPEGGVGPDAELVELGQRRRSHEVAAHLVSGELLAVEDGDRQPGAGKVGGGRPPARAAADHDDVRRPG